MQKLRDVLREREMMKLSSINTISCVVTPDCARYALEERSGINRHLDKKRVEKYAERMRAGRWVHNGETIIFANNPDIKGVRYMLCQGQHRLSASVLSDCCFQSEICFGVNFKKAMPTLDSGKVRTFGNVLNIHQVPYWGIASFVTKFLYLYYEKGIEFHDIRHRMIRVSNDEAEDYYNSHPEISDSVKAVSRLARAGFGSRRKIFSSLHYHATQVLNLPDSATSFINGVVDDGGLFSVDPRKALRDFLLRCAGKKGVKFSEEYKNMAAVIAFNSHIKGEEIQKNSLTRMVVDYTNSGTLKLIAP